MHIPAYPPPLTFVNIRHGGWCYKMLEKVALVKKNPPSRLATDTRKERGVLIFFCNV